MKKVFAVAMVLMLALSALAFAGPYVGFDFTIPDDGALRLGYITEGPLTLELSVVDMFVARPGLGFKGIYAEEYNYWDSKMTLWITKIDPVSTYPIPTIDGLGAKWRGTIHIGDLAGMISEPPTEEASSWYTFDIYGEIVLLYDTATLALTPTGSLGFYWEP